MSKRKIILISALVTMILLLIQDFILPENRFIEQVAWVITVVSVAIITHKFFINKSTKSK
ncbi:hypothetical protein GLW07_17240 [Bacillus hwajinpoensis]|uniref:Uncharacterized protein n=1 Tax=Guptibacillus hwajinpoensis TaxID=208199 RepID=A0A845F352_9BACL|nr:hypothetical protein [Pseudalkalibacillus hwajinpoensis]MYL65105.1 hypothetical protein [Pseudalkalibacillus hwajinpoensis]